MHVKDAGLKFLNIMYDIPGILDVMPCILHFVSYVFYNMRSVLLADSCAKHSASTCICMQIFMIYVYIRTYIL